MGTQRTPMTRRLFHRGKHRVAGKATPCICAPGGTAARVSVAGHYEDCPQWVDRAARLHIGQGGSR